MTASWFFRQFAQHREIANDAITPKKRDSKVQNDLYEKMDDDDFYEGLDYDQSYIWYW